ncbi:hypothetical protein NFI96_000627 [Prochilodus magdalenae]|nr:hypothetical protein NFI96_000627 [Prochilodus magdalenae]
MLLSLSPDLNFSWITEERLDWTELENNKPANGRLFTEALFWDLGIVPVLRPFLSQGATQLLVQSLVISRLDYCNSLLAGFPPWAIRPLQLVQNAAARLIFSLPKFTHVTPLLRSLHWLPVVARIGFKTLMLAYKAKNGPAPPYLMAMVKSRAVPRALRASSTARLEPPSLRTHGRQASRLFSVLAPRWWNELPLGVRTAESLAVFKRRLKTHLFIMHLRMSTGLGLPAEAVVRRNNALEKGKNKGKEEGEGDYE